MNNAQPRTDVRTRLLPFVADATLANRRLTARGSPLQESKQVHQVRCFPQNTLAFSCPVRKHRVKRPHASWLNTYQARGSLKTHDPRPKTAQAAPHRPDACGASAAGRLQAGDGISCMKND